MTQLAIRRHPSLPGSTHGPPALRSRHDRRPSRVPGRPRLGLRLRVWLREYELETALARGADAGASDELDLRARQLTRPEQRARLADAIEELVDLADRHEVLVNSEALAAATSPHVQLDRIRTYRSLLLQLVSRLRAEGSVDVQGLAKTRQLLRDDRSPLYHRDATPSLEEAVTAAIDALESSPVLDTSLEQAAGPGRLARTPASCAGAAHPKRWRSRARGV